MKNDLGSRLLDEIDRLWNEIAKIQERLDEIEKIVGMVEELLKILGRLKLGIK